MSRSEKIRAAIQQNNLAVYRGRPVGTPSQLATLAGVAYTTVKNAYSIYKVTVYKLIGAGVLVDALNLAEYFDQAKIGRKPSK